MNYDTVYAFDLADLAQFVKLEVPQLEQCFEEFRRKGMIVTSSTRHGCYEELDTLLLSQPLDVFSCPVDPV
jgi:DNA-binding IscR family transcriptional regulator